MEKILARALGEDVSKMATGEKQHLLSRLLARVAHEVRNPLSSLDIHVQLLEEDLAQAPEQIKEKAAARFEIIHGELHRLENIVKQFLNLAGSSALDIEPVDIAKTLEHVGNLLRPEAAARNIEILCSVQPPVSPFLADPGKLTQALLNLFINAIQAVARNGRIEAGATLNPEQSILSITVRDTGAGVPEEKRATIFEPYFTTKPEGTGLGLWVVQQIVTAHSGSVLVSDAPGGGALFTIKLPFRKAIDG
jgi:two-component system sensor histidine kinase HydH